MGPLQDGNGHRIARHRRRGWSAKPPVVHVRPQGRRTQDLGQRPGAGMAAARQGERRDLTVSAAGETLTHQRLPEPASGCVV